MELFLFILEIVGTVAFAVAGAMTAMKRKLDILGVVILSVITACGGGLLRDVLLGISPASLFKKPLYVIISALTGLIMFIIFYIIKKAGVSKAKWYKTVLTLADAIGLGVFVVIGANKTLEFDKNASMFLICFMATITAVGGGVIRDILVNKIPNVFVKHLYAIPTILGSILLVCCDRIGVSQYITFPIILVYILIFRMLAYKFELSLPFVKFKDLS